MNKVRRSRTAGVAVALLAMVFASCSGDDGPAGVGLGSGGGGSNADRSVTVSLNRGDWNILETYHESGDFTRYQGIGSVGSAALNDVSPGMRIAVTIQFSDPLRTIRDVPSVAIYATSQSGLVAPLVAPSVSSVGSWSPDCPADGYLLGSNGILTSFFMQTCFQAGVGDRLNSVTFECTIPSKFNIGSSIGTTPSLPVGNIAWTVDYPGDHRGEGAPIVAF